MSVGLSRTVDIADVKAVVVETLGIRERADALDATTPLLGSLPELDSMAVLELIVELERRFGITVEDEDVTADAFETIGSLAEFVNARVH
ncbi:MAG: acyl carrier protein [Solirubrobacterales bacterium]